MTVTEIPERRRVMRASAVGILIGSFVAVIAVLPAEYGIDPTGLGQSLGLIKLSDVTSQEPDEVGTETEESVASSPASGASRRNHQLVLAPGDGAEFKVLMDVGAEASFRWIASDVVHFDQHGEPEGDTTGYFESYAIGAADSIEGKFTALFSGTHGWYWRNDSDSPITVDLVVAGEIAEAPGYE